MRLRQLLPLLLALAVACTSADFAEDADGNSTNRLADLAPGWNMIRPGGETTCAQNTEFAFFARAASTDKLLVYLQGGGACWDAATCDPQGEPTYSRDVDERDNPAGRPTGIFALENPANPLRDHSMVMIPYCTGDVHLGDTITTYTVQQEGADSRNVTVHHRGYVNVMAALDWVARNFDEPRQIVVAGSSAGSIPSPFYADVLADRYPGAEIVALGDASGSYRREPGATTNPAAAWKMLEVVQNHAGFEDFNAESLDFPDLYIVAAQQHPEMRLLRFDAANDQVQLFFLERAFADTGSVAAMIARNGVEIRQSVSDFRSYLAGGPEHTVLWREAFYNYEVGETLFRDWFAAVVSGRTVPDVDCSAATGSRDSGACERPGIHLTDADALIAERALEMLVDETAWNRTDNGRCNVDDDSLVSLRCALFASTAIAGGRPVRDAGAVLEALFEARDRLGDAEYEGSALVAFNNSPATQIADVRSLLRTVAQRSRRHIHH